MEELRAGPPMKDDGKSEKKEVKEVERFEMKEKRLRDGH